MSKKTLAERLFIREDYAVLLLNAPKDYEDALGPLPKNAQVVAKSTSPVDFIQVFAATRAEMVEYLARARPLLKEDGLLWATYPKAGQLNTDLKREVVWECAGDHRHASRIPDRYRCGLVGLAFEGRLIKEG